MRWRAALLALGCLVSGACAAQSTAQQRPRTGLVLSGGGARGLAHVGVLKVLERERIPVDLIAGTSMGAIIGGLYASGMSATEIEREIVQLRWDEVFATRVNRPQLPERRKELDADYSPAIELGMRDGVLMTPKSALASRGLEALLRRYTLRAGSVHDFDRLPLPFRAVATDMESGRAVVLGSGDLAVALRSSMSVPGVFAPTEVEGRVLGDGGLVDNVPVDVARAMGAQRLIVVNIGTPLAPRETLSSVLGLTTQMINILTEQNVQRSLATLAPQDVLVAPELGKLGSSDFDKARELIALGERGAEAALAQLRPLALNPAEYAAWRAGRPQAAATAAQRLAFVRFEGSSQTRPERYAPAMESQAGQPFDAGRAERDAARLSASGDYARSDFRLEHTPDGDGLVFELEDKPWGPNYFRIGLDLSTDFSGRSAFDLKLGHTRRWLTDTGTEWRNRLQIGETTALDTELYHPLAGVPGRVGDWFVAGYAGAERRLLTLYRDEDGHELAEFRRTTGRLGVDVGQPWSRFGELRVGLQALAWRTSPRLLGSDYGGPRDAEVWQERGLRVRAVVDQLDFASFPLHGYRFESELGSGERHGRGGHERYNRLETEGSVVASRGADTLNVYGLLDVADTPGASVVGRYALGGFQQLSGYRPGQLVGNALLFGRLEWYHRLTQPLVLTRGFFVGGTLEAGNAWSRWSELGLHELRTGMSVFLGADTGIGPLYLGLTYAPRGEAGVVLFIGRP